MLNPVSGGKNKGGWETSIRDWFKGSPHQYELYNTTGDSDKESLKYWINDWKPDKVVSVGGDGTLKLTAEVLLGSDIPICIFPAGSANGMAREMSIAPDFESCMNMLLHGELRRVDIIRINGKQICLHLSDIGINAQLVKYFEENDMRGKLGYAKEIFRVLWRKRLLDLTIKKGDKQIRRHGFMVVIANASMYGTGAVINPKGDLHDGLFEVVILRKLSFMELLKMLVFHRPFDPRKTEIIQTDELTVEVKHNAYFQIDGEYMGKTRKVNAAVEKGALLLMFPPAAEKK